MGDHDRGDLVTHCSTAMSHANKGRLKQQVEDELRTLYVCPDALKQHSERLLKGEQGWSQRTTQHGCCMASAGSGVGCHSPSGSAQLGAFSILLPKHFPPLNVAASLHPLKSRHTPAC